MSYPDDVDRLDIIRWRRAVASAIKDKREQVFLVEMLESLDAKARKRERDEQARPVAWVHFRTRQDRTSVRVVTAVGQVNEETLSRVRRLVQERRI